MLLSSLSHFFFPFSIHNFFILPPAAVTLLCVKAAACCVCVCIPSRLFTHTLLLLFFFSPRHNTSMWIRRSNVYHPRDRHPARSGGHFFFFFSPRVWGLLRGSRVNQIWTTGLTQRKSSSTGWSSLSLAARRGRHLIFDSWWTP